MDNLWNDEELVQTLLEVIRLWKEIYVEPKKSGGSNTKLGNIN